MIKYLLIPLLLATSSYGKQVTNWSKEAAICAHTILVEYLKPEIVSLLDPDDHSQSVNRLIHLTPNAIMSRTDFILRGVETEISANKLQNYSDRMYQSFDWINKLKIYKKVSLRVGPGSATSSQSMSKTPEIIPETVFAFFDDSGQIYIRICIGFITRSEDSIIVRCEVFLRSADIP